MRLMPARGLPLRTSLWLPILAMGVVAIALVLATSYIYRDLTIENRRQAIQQLIQIKSGELLEKLADDSRSLAAEIQRTPNFRNAVDRADQAVIADHLDNQFHRYFNTAGVIQLRKLYVFDRNYRLLAESSKLFEGGEQGEACSAMLDQARQRSAAHHLKTISGLCMASNTAVFATLAPIGSLQLHGFIMVMAEPSKNLAVIGRQLGMPVNITPPKGAALFQSPNWPVALNQAEVIIAEYQLKADTGQVVLTLALANDIHVLERDLYRARNVVLTVAGVATALVALLTLLGLQRSLLNPLRNLLQNFQVLERDRKHLGEQIAVTGNREIRSLVEAYNRMTTELGSLYGKLEELAFRDSLTNLPNRHMFYDRLEQEIKKSHRSGLPMALLLLDLDRFKEVNDSLGHAQGDVLLVEAARRITECVRESDTVARLGGDEFTVILSEVEDINSVERIAQNIIERLAAPFQLLQEMVHVSASVGITLYPNDAKDIEALMKNADQAMYVAKNAGRNRFSYFTAALQEAAQTRLHLLSDLRNALAGKQLAVYYQPIVEIASGKIHKAEALLRWQHPVRGMVSPMQFIPLAEESGLIHEIGDWVFHEAARQVKRCREMFVPQFQISVNKSPMQFRDNGSDYVSWPSHLCAMDLPGNSLAVEITEGLLLNAEVGVTEKLLLFREAGIEVALDDFGTGYSSLSYLKKFDIDYLKIDQSFVRNMGDDPDDQALCEAIIVMAHKLGLKVIAEGVETELQRDLLASYGCDYAQGWLYSKAVPAGEFEALLKEQAK